MSFLSQPKTFKLRNTYVNGFLDCSGDILLRAGNVIIGNISQPGYNANQLSVLVHGRTEMNGNVIVNGNLLVSSNNIALGLRAGNIVNGIQDGVPNGLNTTAVGSFSGMNHTGLNNTFVGSVAGQSSSTTYASRTGSNNTYVGYRTSANNTAWGNSTAVGTGAVITASNQIVLGTAEEIVTTAGNVRITNTTTSTSPTAGALVVTGGIGTIGQIIAGGSIYAGYGNNRSVELSADAVNTAYIDFHSLDAVSNDYDSRIKSVGGTSGTSGRGALTLESESVTITGNTTISKTTASTTSTNGALVVSGGLGVGGAINAAGTIKTPSSIVTNDAFISQASTADTGYLRIVSTGSANYIQSGLNGTSDSVAPLLFTSSFNGREAMRLDVANKRLGIGTTAPDSFLEVKGSASTAHNVPPDGGYNHNLKLTSTKTGSTVYSMALGVDFTSGAGYINAAGNGLIQPVCLQTRGGNVGIGTLNPLGQLHLFYTEENRLVIERDPGSNYIDVGSVVGGIHFRSADYSWNSQKSGASIETYVGTLDYNGSCHEIRFRTLASPSATSLSDRMIIKHTGNVGIGTTTPEQLFHVNGTAKINRLLMPTGDYIEFGHNAAGKEVNAGKMGYNLFSSALDIVGAGAPGVSRLVIIYDRLMMSGSSIAMVASGATLGFRNQDNVLVAYISNVVAVDQIDFTGQHRAFIKNIPFSQINPYIGLIVIADNNKYVSIQNIEIGLNAIKMNESIPICSLSNKENDKRVFGVISGAEDTDSRTYSSVAFVSNIQKEDGDTRIFINSLGEGAIWVSNINGNLESGDYITSASIPGYGMRQNDDLLHNYTVAKITMDCDFNPLYQPSQTILKDASGNNILDSNGEIQWTDKLDTSGNIVYEYAYEIRYILPDGTIILKQEYDVKNANNETVYIAAFVGCTYHCG